METEPYAEHTVCLCILSHDCIRSRRGEKIEETDLGLGADSED